MIDSIGNISYTTYAFPSAGSAMSGSVTAPVTKISSVKPVSEKNTLYISKPRQTQCQTCKNRKYMDVSNETDVSFQSPTHISPEASFAAVSAHEQQHVSNAAAAGSQPGNQLLSASVTYKMGICPECGKPYIAGGTTATQIRYNKDNPYETSRKALEASLLPGMNFDAVA